MSDSLPVCPRCGNALDRSARDPVRGDAEVCLDCYFESFDLVEAPDRIELAVCGSCGAVDRGDSWEDVGARDYTDVAVEAVSEALSVHLDAREVAWEARPEQVDETTVRVHAHVSGVARGRPVEETAVVSVKMGRETCHRCGLMAGDYYAATVQVRARDRDPTDAELAGARTVADEFVADREAVGDRGAFVTSIEEVDGGLDVRTSTSQAGRAIADRVVERFGGEVSRSRRLITEDGDGQRVYRSTFAVRLPRYRPGEVVDPGDGEGPVLVESARQTIRGRRLASGAAYAVEADAVEADRLGHVADAAETTLVAVEDDHAVQVLDPESYRAETIPRPDYLDPEADTVPVLRAGDGLYVLPADADLDVETGAGAD